MMKIISDVLRILHNFCSDFQPARGRPIFFRYFTISPTGVVHFPLDQPSEQIGLARWLHQSLLFSVLSSMSLFKNWRRHKFMRLWMQRVRLAQFMEKRVVLSQKLFFAKTLFGAALVEIWSLAKDMEGVRAVSVGIGSVYGVEEFSETQNLQRTAAMRKIETNFSTLTKRLDELWLLVHKASVGLEGREATSKFIVKRRLQEAELKRCRDRARADVFGFRDFVKLCDAIWVASVVDIAIFGCAELAARLELGAKLFSLSVSFNPVDEDSLNNSSSEQTSLMTLEPSLSELHDCLHGVARSALQQLSAIQTCSGLSQYQSQKLVQAVPPWRLSIEEI